MRFFNLFLLHQYIPAISSHNKKDVKAVGGFDARSFHTRVYPTMCVLDVSTVSCSDASHCAAFPPMIQSLVVPSTPQPADPVKSMGGLQGHLTMAHME
jgi:hypothetical protein